MEYTDKKTGRILHIPDDAYLNISLEDYILILHSREREDELDVELEAIAMGLNLEDLDEDDLEIKEAELFSKKMSEVWKQLVKIVPDKDHHFLSKMDNIEWLHLRTKIMQVPMEDVAKVGFKCPEATENAYNQLKVEYRDKYPRWNIVGRQVNWKDVALYKSRLKVLKEGAFIIKEVQEALMAVKVQHDNITKKYPQLPKEITDYLKSNDVSAKDYMERFIEYGGTTLEEMKAALHRKKEIKKHQNKLDQAVYESAPNIMAHLCIPVGEEYLPSRVPDFIEAFKKLPMRVVMPIMVFFSIIRESLNQNSLLYSIPKTKLPFSQNGQHTTNDTTG